MDRMEAPRAEVPTPTLDLIHPTVEPACWAPLCALDGAGCPAGKRRSNLSLMLSTLAQLRAGKDPACRSRRIAGPSFITSSRELAGFPGLALPCGHSLRPVPSPHLKAHCQPLYLHLGSKLQGENNQEIAVRGACQNYGYHGLIESQIIRTIFD